MARGRQRAEWERADLLACMIISPWTKNKPKVGQFNPFAEEKECKQLTKEEHAEEQKSAWMNFVMGYAKPPKKDKSK